MSDVFLDKTQKVMPHLREEEPHGNKDGGRHADEHQVVFPTHIVKRGRRRLEEEDRRDEEARDGDGESLGSDRGREDFGRVDVGRRIDG